MPRTYTFFIHLRALPAWLALARQKRAEFSAQKLEPIFEKYPTVKVRWYDVEAFSTKASDIAVFETTSLQDYYFVIDAIRDSELCTVPYFEFVDIIPAIEDGYVEYENSL
ncbi:darcynin family protein [Acinetobacter baumannii]|nr:Darcynin 1 [Acinetobacter baumannii]EKW4875981.1 Darcynin 1 [Acinetobacter baumannii]EKW4877308.1 Darcynin 1 [Acinetobacter baumannii]HAV5299418.1 Darcynin 1 [Acinetobacter baumannii]HAV5398781.1 Darcynin 1 [Acinetobacter baumannii]